MRTARSIAFGIYSEIDKKQLYANIEVPRQLNLSELSSSEKARVTDLVHGTFRWQLFLATAIEISANRNKEKIETSILNLLCLAGYEILFGKTAKEILVSEWVNEAKRNIGEKSAGFVNAVLRRISEKDFLTWQSEISARYPNRMDLVWSHPAWIIDKYREVISDEKEIIKLLNSNNEPPVLWHFKQNQDGANSALAPTAKIATNRSSSEVRFQDAASQAAAYLLANFRVNEMETDWLDACAAPGGKTTTLAQTSPLKNVKITAVDIHPHKEQLIKQSTKSLKNIEVLIGDSRLSPWKDKKFDRVLIDAPCTGLGAIRRRSESRWKKHASDIKELTSNAKEIFDAAFKSTKNYGYIEYVVCSPIIEETDEFVRWALASYPHLRLIPPEEYLTVFGENGAKDYVTLSKNGLRFWPHLHNSDAMFVSLFQVIRST